MVGLVGTFLLVTDHVFPIEHVERFFWSKHMMCACAYSSIKSMLERLVVKTPIKRTRQCVIRTSALRVMVSVSPALDLSFGCFVRSLGRSFDRPFSHWLNRLVDRSLDRSLGRSLTRSLTRRSTARSIPRSIAHSPTRLLARSIAPSFARSMTCLLAR